MLRFTALGDSTTVGLGDPVPGGWRGWAVLLTQCLGAELTNLATEGARVADVRTDQLPAALVRRPHLASVVAGANDTLRADFDAAGLRRDIDATLGELRATGAVVLTMALPDPRRVCVRLPRSLTGALARRVAVVNDAYAVAAERHGCLHLDLSSDARVCDPGYWGVDRMHPSERGHRWLARSFSGLLGGAGIPVDGHPSLDCSGGATRSGWQDAAWMVRRGTPWFAKRALDFGPELWRIAREERSLAASLGSDPWHAPTAARPMTSVPSPSPAAGSTTPRAASSWSSDAPASSALRA